MSKQSYWLWFVVLFVFIGCASDPINKSKVNVQINDFVITSIQKGAEDRIVCTGFRLETEEPILIEYNEELNDLRTTNLSNNPKFKGVVKLTSLQENGYLATCFLNNELPKRLMLYRTDVNLNVVDEYEVEQWNDTNSAVKVRDLKELKNGDFILAFDSMSQGSQFGGFRIQRFDKNLQPLFTYSDNIQDYVGQYAPHLVELPDESLFYVVATNNSNFGGPFKSLRTGRLSKSGSSLYANFTSVEYGQIQPIGLSLYNNKAIYQMLVNKEIIHSLSIDFNTGTIIVNKEMSYNEVNHFNEYGTFLNNYPFILLPIKVGAANPLPLIVGDQQGQVLFTKATGKLIHVRMDDQLNFTPNFDITLPNFDAVSSYRHLYLEDGKMVVGASYNYSGKPYFNIQMLNSDGTVVQ